MSKVLVPQKKGSALASACAFVLAMILILSGCANLPTSGEPHEFAIDVPTREPIGQYGSGPQAGSTPSVLVEDFLRACAAGAFDDYAVARKYLMPQVADSWIPTSQVIVFPTDTGPEVKKEVTDDDSSSIALQISTIASVDERGVLHELPEAGSTALTFELAKDQEGEWRISALDDGLVLSQNAFTTGFGQYDLYFSARSADALVADPRWYPRLRTASHLVAGMLAGPSGEIAGALMDDLGGGLSLLATGVEVRERTAHVELEGTVTVSQEDRELIMWQIEAALSQLPDIQSVEVWINSVQVDPSQLPVGPQYALDRVVAVIDDAISVISTDGTVELVKAQTLDHSPTSPSIGPLEDSPLAWLDEEENRVFILRGRDITPVSVSRPSKPSIDRFGNVWTVDQDSSKLVRIGTDNEVSTVENPLGSTTLSRVFVAPDGARVVLLAEGDEGGALWMGTLVPGEGGDVSIESIEAIDRVSGDVLDATWTGATGLSALVASGEGEETVIRSAPVGGWASRYLAPAGVTSVTAGANTRGLIVQRPDQTAFQRSGAAWLDLGNARAYLSAPG